MGFIDNLFGISQSKEDISSLQKEIWDSTLKRYKFSDFLPYCVYKEDEGIYYNNDNSYGCVFLCSPRIRMGKSTADSIEEILNKLPDDLFIQFSLFGSKNIYRVVETWKREHLKRADKENNELLKKAVESMNRFYFSKTKKGVSRSMQTRIKNFVLIISIRSESKDTILHTRDFLRNVLSTGGFYPQEGNPYLLKPILYEIFNGNHDINHIPKYDDSLYINRQIIAPDSEILVHDTHIELDKRSFVTLVPQTFPKEASIFDFGEKLGDYLSNALDVNQFKDSFLITTSICKLPKSKANKVSQIHSFILTQNWSEALFRNFAAARKESVEILDRINQNKELLYAIDMNVVIGGDNYEEASKNAHTIMSYWNKGGDNKALNLIEAMGIHQLNLIASLPMGINKEYVFDVTAKFRTMFADQASQFVPLEADYAGTNANLLLFSRRGQICGLDLFVSNSNFNGFLVATSGAGKSVFLNMVAFNTFARGDRVFIVDQDNSFVNLCNTIGGQYVSLDPQTPISFNPFSEIKSFEDLYEDLEYLSVFIYMLGSSKNQNEADKDEKLIKSELQEVLKKLYQKKKNRFDISDIQKIMQEKDDPRFKDFAHHLRPFCKGGIYEKFLAGDNEFNISKEFIVIEFKGVEDHPDLRDPLVMLLIYHINQLMYMSPDREAKIQIIIDEAHKFLGKNPKMDDFIEQLYRRARKYGGSAIIATQGFDDIYSVKNGGGLSRAGSVIINNSAYKIFMKQTDVSSNLLIQSNIFSFSKIDEQILKSIGTVKGEYSELFLITPDEVMFPYRLAMDKYFYYLTTTDANDKAKIKELMQKEGLSFAQAVETLVLRESHE
ncbi:TraC family protein [Campylobacter lari]|uniref:TraG/VirB4 family ATPase n=1 Tax=Campylobacter lari TaxID=201 RepID=UPI00126A7B76|nr:TraC family protein [Campylobacter lari]MBT0826693.1 TraC family protein [Campylobacter lari]